MLDEAAITLIAAIRKRFQLPPRHSAEEEAFSVRCSRALFSVSHLGARVGLIVRDTES
jgi:hypothetical protein